MARRLIKAVAICLLPALALTGCWSYRGLNEITIVMGMGIDRDPETGETLITAETVDLTKPLEGGSPGSKIITARGQTLFDALRNAKKRLVNRLYIGNIQIIMLGEETARTEGILDAVDWSMRDGEGRETINLVIAQGTTAKEMLTQKGIDQNIVSLEVDEIIDEDNKDTSSTAHVELYQAYYILHCPGQALTLPAFHITENDGEPALEANGIAVFRRDKLAGFLTPEESKFLLIATDKCRGGILPLQYQSGEKPDIGLEIQNSQARTSFTYANGQFTFRIETETNVYLGEMTASIDVLDEEQIRSIEQQAGEMVRTGIERLVSNLQTELQLDALSLGYKVYQMDVGLWKQIAEAWETIFPTVSVEVSSKVNIVNTAFIKSKETVDK